MRTTLETSEELFRLLYSKKTSIDKVKLTLKSSVVGQTTLETSVVGEF